MGFDFCELRGSPPLDEQGAMICRKWRGSEKETKEKKIKAQPDMNYTLIEIVNRSRQSQTKAPWLGVSAFGLNMQFSEFKSGCTP